MSERNLFEIATRNQYRFASGRGNVSIEDLWQLPLTLLDAAYKDYVKAVRETEDESLLDLRGQKKVTTELADKRDIIKHVVLTRQAENAAKEEARARRTQAARIRELIEENKNKELARKSDEELQELLKKLEVE